ncbi:30S ribosomal protein S20 [Bdellovibrionota bacterium]
MATHKSAKKRARQNIKRAERNKTYRTRFRSVIKAVRAAAEAKDLKKAKEALRIAIPTIDIAASKNVIKQTTAKRYISRLTKTVNQISA